VKPEDGARFYFFHVDTRKTVWKLPEGAKKMSLSAYKQQEAKKVCVTRVYVSVRVLLLLLLCVGRMR